MGASGGYNTSASNPGIYSPFGNMPGRQAGQFGNQYSSPLGFGLGFGPTEGRGARRYGDFEGQLATANGPLADYIRQSRDFLPGVFGQAQNTGTEIATRAPGLFNQLQNQISGFLSNLPGMQAQAGQQAGQAQGFLDQASSPIASQALFQNANRGLLDSARGSGAARGLLDSGGQQAQEEGLTRDLAAQYAQSQAGNQQAALQGAQGALGTQAAIGQAGINPAQTAFSSLQPYQNALAQSYQAPMDALSSVFAQISGAQNPQLALLSQILPQIANTSRSKGFQQQAGI